MALLVKFTLTLSDQLPIMRTMCSTTPINALASVLPRQLDPRKFAQQGVGISGSVDVKALVRLTPLLANDDTGKINATLLFGVDEQRIRNVTGSVDAELAMVCQRCLEPVLESLTVSIKLGMVWNDEKAAALSKSWEPWILEEGQTDIYQMIEDELILGLPIVAYHSSECVAHEMYTTENVDAETKAKASSPINKNSLSEATSERMTSKPNPFQVLEELKGSLEKASDNIDPDVTKH